MISLFMEEGMEERRNGGRDRGREGRRERGRGQVSENVQYSKTIKREIESQDAFTIPSLY